MNKLQGTLLYVNVPRPVACFDKAKGTEWKVSIAVDEDQADEFDALKTKQVAKKVKRSEFESIYKVPAPEGDGKNLYVITLKKNTHYKDSKTGERKPVAEAYHPKVLLQEGDERTDITNEKLVGNGSKGMISFEIRNSVLYGDNAQLKNVLVTDLIEYVRTDRDSGNEFDDVAPPVKKAPSKKKETAKVESTEEESGGPF